MVQTFLVPIITSSGYTAQLAGTFTFAAGPRGHVVFGEMPAPQAGSISFGGGILDSGVATLVAGTATVLSASALAANPIVLGYYSVDGSLATVAYGTIVDGVSFVITSSNEEDTNKVSWVIL